MSKGRIFRREASWSTRTTWLEIYETGTGKIKLRGRVERWKIKRGGRNRLVITEIPYTMMGAGHRKVFK